MERMKRMNVSKFINVYYVPHPSGTWSALCVKMTGRVGLYSVGGLFPDPPEGLPSLAWRRGTIDTGRMKDEWVMVGGEEMRDEQGTAKTHGHSIRGGKVCKVLRRAMSKRSGR